MAWPGRFWQIVKSFASPLQSTVERRRRLGLSAKLLLLTILFVMLAEVLIFVPSVANFRITWLTDRLTAAQLAALAAEAVPGGVVPDALRLELLRTAQVKAVALKRDNERRLVLPADGSLNFDSTYDFRSSARPSGIIDQLALRFGGVKDFGNALRVTVYSFTPLWVAGVFQLVPGLRFVGSVVAIFGIYLLWTGLPRLMKVPADKAVPYVATAAACAIVIAISIGLIQAALIS